MNRRRFLRYASATAAVVGASALGIDYLLKPQLVGMNLTSSSTSTPAPPSIVNFQWQPTSVVNDKVYDATLSFDVISETNVSDLSAVLEDYAPTIPKRAYPTESLRPLQLQSSLSSNVGTHSANLVNLKGGKQYKVTAAAKNSVGDAKSEFDTPYVREFENIAKLDNVIVGAAYHPWWNLYSWEQWGANIANGTTPLGSPLLGLYDSNDQLVISKHLDWATGHGIDYFYVSYPFADPKPLLQNALIKDFKVGILYEMGALANSRNQDIHSLDLNSAYSTLQAHFDYMAANLFPHPSFLRIDGRPVVYTFASGLIQGDIREPFVKLKRHMRDIGFEPYIIGDEMGNWGGQIPQNRLKAYDAITSYGLPPMWYESQSPTSHEKTRYEYARWRSAAHAVGVEVVPSVYPGYDNAWAATHLPSYGGYGSPPVRVPRSVEFFKSNLEVALEFVDRSRLLMVVSWDEWGENSFVEPSVEDGFKYLQTLRDTLAGH